MGGTGPGKKKKPTFLPFFFFFFGCSTAADATQYCCLVTTHPVKRPLGCGGRRLCHLMYRYLNTLLTHLLLELVQHDGWQDEVVSSQMQVFEKEAVLDEDVHSPFSRS